MQLDTSGRIPSAVVDPGFPEDPLYSHLRRKQASLFHADIRFSAHPNPESLTLSTGSVRRFAWQVYKLSATNRGCLQVEYSSTPALRRVHALSGAAERSDQRQQPSSNLYLGHKGIDRGQRMCWHVAT